MLDNIFLPTQFFFFSDFQDFLSILLFYSPELIIVLFDYINSYWFLNTFLFDVNIVYDVFSDKLFVISSQLLSYFIMFFMYI